MIESIFVDIGKPFGIEFLAGVVFGSEVKGLSQVS